MNMLYKKAVLFGANGQLGMDLQEVFGALCNQLLIPNHQTLELANENELSDFLKQHNPDLIINAAAYHNVELCEQNPVMAQQINAVAPKTMAAFANKTGAKFVHFSTNYVFDGNQNMPYTEIDTPNPINEYGKSKYLGEQWVLQQNKEALIIRLAGLYGIYPCRAKNGLNFVQLMLKLATQQSSISVVNHEWITPTNTQSIAEVLPNMLNKNLDGIYHLTASGFCTWFEFAQAIFELSNKEVDLKVREQESTAGVQRPAYGVLSNDKLLQHGVEPLLPWRLQLLNYLKEINELA